MEIIDLGDDGRVHRVRFLGVVYRRYPAAKQSSDRNYFRAGPGDIGKGRSYLHRDVWVSANGAIPDGHEIDHEDGNPLNNELPNLRLLTSEEHAAKHRESGRQRCIARIANMPADRRAAMLAAAAAWHKSEEGRAWHREHGKRVAAGMADVRSACEHCGGEYTTKANRRTVSKYCTNSCKAAARRESGADDEVRPCHQCGFGFMCNRYAYVKFCGRVCARAARRARSKPGVQPHGG
jgi:hypothetical protein